MPAYNEESRITAALEEMVEYLDQQFGRPGATQQHHPPFLQPDRQEDRRPRNKARRASAQPPPHRLVFKPAAPATPTGYEILIVDDGSADRTAEVALAFSHRHDLHDILRVVRLEKNRGKGGAVTPRPAPRARAVRAVCGCRRRQPVQRPRALAGGV